MDYDYERAAYEEFLGQLVEGLDINDPNAEGITKKVIADGEASLRNEQRSVFNTKVKSVFHRPKCSLCEQLVERDIAYKEIGSSKPRCNSCDYRYQKTLEECPRALQRHRLVCHSIFRGSK